MNLKEKLTEQFESNPQLRILFFFDDGSQSCADEVNKIVMPKIPLY